ncbi:MAG TPA: ThiF family adenylyltransferase [Polyangiaceae bacterium]|nr:ThiF family adenylyltransferase [Polyangiaceae bacterium]
MASPAATYDCLRAAGRDPEILHRRRLGVVGCGNAGSNTTSTLSVLGIETVYIDMDVVEPKNLAHSPFLDVVATPNGSPRFKAELLASAHVEVSRRADQVAQWAALPIQAVPWGVLRKLHGLIVGVDDGPSRGWIARTAALLGIPTVVVGFLPPTGNFVAVSNRDESAPCFFCLRPRESPLRASCSLYSSPSDGVNPALQTAAAATMNVAIEAMTRFWHEDYRYDGKVFRLDLDDGASDLTGFRVHPDCPGPHERLPEPSPAPFEADSPAAAVLELAEREGLRRPALELPSRYVVSLPCRACGRVVPVGKPEWMVRTAPVCPSGCAVGGAVVAPVFCEVVAEGTALAARSLSSLGVGPLGLCVVADAEGDEVRVYELPGHEHSVLNTCVRVR